MYATHVHFYPIREAVTLVSYSGSQGVIEFQNVWNRAEDPLVAADSIDLVQRRWQGSASLPTIDCINMKEELYLTTLLEV